MKITILFGICLILFSCNNSSKSEYEVRKEQRQKKEKIIEEEISKLNKNNNIAFCWDTLDLKYSFLYESILSSGNQLIRNPDILDIQKFNSSYIIEISCGYEPLYYFKIHTSNENYINQIINNSYDEKMLFIVKIKDLKKFSFDINPIDDWENAYIDLEYSNNFYGNGNLIQLKAID